MIDFEDLNDYAKKRGIKFGEMSDEDITREEFNEIENKFEELCAVAVDIAFKHAIDPYAVVIAFLEAALEVEKKNRDKAYEMRDKFIESLDFLPDALKKKILESI